MWLAISSGIGLALFASGSRAEAPAVVLSWQTPPDAQCASGEDMRERVARLSERPLALDGNSAGPRIAAIVSSNGATWQAVVTLVDGAGRPEAVRTIEGRTPNCGSVDVAAAVVIATMLDGLPAPTSGVEPPVETAAADGGGLQLGAFVIASPGLIPRAWLGGGVEVLVGSSFAVLIEASVYAPAEQGDSLGRGARLWGFHAGGGLCPQALRAGRLELRLCASAQAGVQFASGVRLTYNTDSNLPIVLMKLGPRLRYEVASGVSLQLGLSAAWVVVRPRVHWEIEAQPLQELRSDAIALLAQIGFVISME